jgi:hypothetical protein
VSWSVVVICSVLTGVVALGLFCREPV